jgi:multiple antibiotic resistance protein
MQFETLAFMQSALFLFAIVDPVGGIPIFIGLTEGTDDHERRRVLRIALLTAFALVVAFALVGSVIMTHVFRISMGEFTFAGGLLLAIVGIRDIVAAGHHGIKPDSSEEGVKQRSMRLHALAVSPIAIPLLAGPGTIVTVILFQGQYGHMFALAVCLAVFAATFVILNFANAIARLFGPVGMLAVSRVMQIFIIAIGVSFMFSGLRQAFPVLFGH